MRLHTFVIMRGMIAAAPLSLPPAVLAVDDDETTRSLIAALLDNHGIPAATVADGAQMWRWLDQAPQRPKVILLDVEMPGEDGFSLAEGLRARYGLTVAIIMLTSRTKGGDKSMGLEVGADDYLTKPCDWRQLVSLVHRHLGPVPTPTAAPAAPTCPVCQGKLERRLESSVGAVLSCFGCGWSHFVGR